LVSERFINRYILKYQKLPREDDPDYLEELVRFKMTVFITDAPDMIPNKCGKCGSGRTGDRKYVDFGLTLEFYGTVYICTICLDEINRNVWPPELASTVAEPILVSDREGVDGVLRSFKIVLEDVKEHFLDLESLVKRIEDVDSANKSRGRTSDPAIRKLGAPLDNVEESSERKSNKAESRTFEQAAESKRPDILSFTELYDRS
jgi:hypothetical protein